MYFSFSVHCGKWANSSNQKKGKRKKTLIAISGIFLIINFWGCQQNKTIKIPYVNGEQLVKKSWQDFGKNNKEVFEDWIAEGFQSVHEFGASSKEEEVEILTNLNLGEYKLANFKTTQNDNLAIVSYTVAVHETIEGKAMLTNPAVRLSVFMCMDNSWKWIAHANLNPMSK